MSRLEFVENLRKAWRIASSNPRSDEWRPTAAIVGGFDAGDFPELDDEERRRLADACESLRRISAAPPTAVGPDEAVAHLRRAAELVAKAVRTEWLQSIGRMYEQAEGWAQNHEWGVLRDTKHLSDMFLGEYDAPVLLVHTPQGRVIFDPVARFVSGADGLVDLGGYPSFDNATMVARTGDQWRLEPRRFDEPQQEWSEKTFVNTVGSLLNRSA